MSSKSKLVTGPLSTEDKVYILENYSSKNLEEIAKKVKRNVTTVTNYLDKLGFLTKATVETKVEPEAPVENFVVSPEVTPKLVSRTGPATVFDGGESTPYFLPTNPEEKNPFKY